MSDKNDGHYTVGDALVILLVALFGTPVGWAFLFLIALGLLPRP